LSAFVRREAPIEGPSLYPGEISTAQRCSSAARATQNSRTPATSRRVVASHRLIVISSGSGGRFELIAPIPSGCRQYRPASLQRDETLCNGMHPGAPSRWDAFLSVRRRVAWIVASPFPPRSPRISPSCLLASEALRQAHHEERDLTSRKPAARLSITGARYQRRSSGLCLRLAAPRRQSLSM
jgi:hypothetical protein